jgi:hypothetical protein
MTRRWGGAAAGAERDAGRASSQGKRGDAPRDGEGRRPVQRGQQQGEALAGRRPGGTTAGVGARDGRRARGREDRGRGCEEPGVGS